MAKAIRSKKSTGHRSRHGRRRSAFSSPSPPHASTPSPPSTDSCASRQHQSSHGLQVVVPQASMSAAEQPISTESESPSVVSSASPAAQTSVEPQDLPAAQSSHANEPSSVGTVSGLVGIVGPAARSPHQTRSAPYSAELLVNTLV